MEHEATARKGLAWGALVIAAALPVWEAGISVLWHVLERRLPKIVRKAILQIAKVEVPQQNQRDRMKKH